MRNFLIILVLFAVAVTPAVADAAEPETIGAFDPAQGRWHLRADNGITTSFYFGNPGDIPLSGDWDCDGVDTPGLYRQSDGFVYLRNTNTQGIAEIRYFTGNPDDTPIAGDFDGDGCDTVSLYRPSEQRFFIINRLGSNDTGIGPADSNFVFGNPGDQPFAGDLNGDGVDDVGLHRATTGLVYVRFTQTTGAAGASFIYGDPGDRFVAGDWSGSGLDTVAVFRPTRGRYLLRYENSPGAADQTLAYGDNDWLPVAGAFDLAPTPTLRKPLVVSGTGDVNLDTRTIPALASKGTAHAWSGTENLFLADHLTVINLECAPSDLGTAAQKTFTFRCARDQVAALGANGIEVANLANNHSQDYGTAAMLDGIDNVRASGAAPVGVGNNITEATTPALFEINGWTVAVLGFGGVYHTSSWLATNSRAGMASGTDTTLMVDAVAAARTQADIVIVTVHWGTERRFVPDADDIPRAYALIDAGADIIFGHHPHRLQPMEFYNGKPIFWSLGNFVWPKHDTASATTAVAEVVIQPDGLINARLIPAFISSPGRPELVD